MVYIYILKLQSNKYYIGKTSNPNFRLEEHESGKGSAWTKKYKPIKLMKLIKNCDSYDEDKHTLRYMELMGIDNVRGGSFCQLKLTNENRKTIERMLNGSSDKCYKCGKKGHFANQCSINNIKEDWTCQFCTLLNSIDTNICNTCGNTKNNKIKNNNYRIVNLEHESVWSCNYCGKGFTSKNGAQYHENFYCKVKKSNYENYSNDNSTDEYYSDDEYDYWSCDYCGKEFDTKKGAQFHENVHCKMKKKSSYKTQKRSYKSSKTYYGSNCYRCGRSGHFSSNCYASKHVKGYYL